ncbi:MAG: HAD family phosphatase [Thermoplasmata archaeon]
MAEVAALLWDVGGVILSNGWDHEGRRAAAAHFELDAAELERRHAGLARPLETGGIDWAQYLSETVFFAPRPFSVEEFRRFVWERSTLNAPAFDTARSLRRSERYVQVALNNESRELNEYRIARFRLGELFHAFLSSCYTGRLKPEPEAFLFALDLLQRTPEECLFLDDRPENIAGAAAVGLRTLLVGSGDQLREDLLAAGVSLE